MQKKKKFINTRFTSDVLKEALYTLQQIAARSNKKLSFHDLTIDHDEETWKYDSLEEFYADYRKYNNTAFIHSSSGPILIYMWAFPSSAEISVGATTRAEIEEVFSIFESAKSTCQLPFKQSQTIAPVVFIGHGGSGQWRDLKDHLQDKHGYRVEAYETGARAGHVIRDILEDMVCKSSFAVLVLTADDQHADGQYSARQNVIHEAGIFQGRLGFARAIMLLEESVDEFSNVHGVQYIRFSKNNIKETFGEVLATLRREFGNDT